MGPLQLKDAILSFDKPDFEIRIEIKSLPEGARIRDIVPACDVTNYGFYVEDRLYFGTTGVLDLLNSEQTDIIALSCTEDYLMNIDHFGRRDRIPLQVGDMAVNLAKHALEERVDVSGASVTVEGRSYPSLTFIPSIIQIRKDSIWRFETSMYMSIDIQEPYARDLAAAEITDGIAEIFADAQSGERPSPPFLYATAPSYTGKTLLAFELDYLAKYSEWRSPGRAVVPVFTQVLAFCSHPGGEFQQAVYNSMAASQVFKDCAFRDYKALAENHADSGVPVVSGSAICLAGKTPFYTFGVIIELLKLRQGGYKIRDSNQLNFSPVDLVTARNAVKELIYRDLPIVVVLDEYNTSHWTTPEQKAPLFFARNLLREIGLAVLLMGTDALPSNLMDPLITMIASRRDFRKPRVSVRLIKRFPKITRSSLLAALGEEYLEDSECKDIPRYARLEKKIAERVSPDFVYWLLQVSENLDNIEACSNPAFRQVSVHGVLDKEISVDLESTHLGLRVLSKKGSSSYCAFHAFYPRLSEDELLYLILLSNGSHRPFGPRSTIQAVIETFKDNQLIKPFLRGSYSVSPEEERNLWLLEAIAVGSLVMASHKSVKGVLLPDFLRALVNELCPYTPERPLICELSSLTDSDYLYGIRIPYIAPHSSLSECFQSIPGVFTGTIVQPPNEEQCNGVIIPDIVTRLRQGLNPSGFDIDGVAGIFFECRTYPHRVKGSEIKEIVRRFCLLARKQADLGYMNKAIMFAFVPSLVKYIQPSTVKTILNEFPGLVVYRVSRRFGACIVTDFLDSASTRDAHSEEADEENPAKYAKLSELPKDFKAWLFLVEVESIYGSRLDSALSLTPSPTSPNASRPTKKLRRSARLSGENESE